MYNSCNVTMKSDIFLLDSDGDSLIYALTLKTDNLTIFSKLTLNTFLIHVCLIFLCLFMLTLPLLFSSPHSWVNLNRLLEKNIPPFA